MSTSTPNPARSPLLRRRATPNCFSPPAAPPPPAWWQALSEEIRRINLDATTPIDALNTLRDIQTRLRET